MQQLSASEFALIAGQDIAKWEETGQITTTSAAVLDIVILAAKLGTVVASDASLYALFVIV